MSGLVAALAVGVLFAIGTYLVLSREQINLILGLNLYSYAVNMLLFTSTTLNRGIPPIIENKESFAGDISQFVDPVPQAMILTAIVISFGITAFMIVLFNRRHTLITNYVTKELPEQSFVANDPFNPEAHYLTGLDEDPEDYDWLEDTLTPETQ
jgi:multicomponent Na+:H+ antiporter subunit C